VPASGAAGTSHRHLHRCGHAGPTKEERFWACWPRPNQQRKYDSRGGALDRQALVVQQPSLRTNIPRVNRSNMRKNEERYKAQPMTITRS
jgi:hypothetical protein